MSRGRKGTDGICINRAIEQWCLIGINVGDTGVIWRVFKSNYSEYWWDKNKCSLFCCGLAHWVAGARAKVRAHNAHVRSFFQQIRKRSIGCMHAGRWIDRKKKLLIKLHLKKYSTAIFNEALVERRKKESNFFHLYFEIFFIFAFFYIGKILIYILYTMDVWKPYDRFWRPNLYNTWPGSPAVKAFRFPNFEQKTP